VDGSRIRKHTTFFLMRSATGTPVPQREEGITECLWVPLARAHHAVSYENAREVVRRAQRIVSGTASELEEDGPPVEEEEGPRAPRVLVQEGSDE